MSTIDRFATPVNDAPRDFPATAVQPAHHTLIDTVACSFAAAATWIGKPCLRR